jgi:squalene cyclase
LTAYALRFLHDAKEFVEVDEAVVAQAREWLIKEQRENGGWPGHAYDNAEGSSTTMTTALIARTLASVRFVVR